MTGRVKKTKRNNSISSPSRHVKMRFLLFAVSFLGVVNDLKPQNFNSLFTEYCKKIWLLISVSNNWMSDLFLCVTQAVDDTTERVLGGSRRHLHLNQPLTTFNVKNPLCIFVLTKINFNDCLTFVLQEPKTFKLLNIQRTKVLLSIPA